MNKMEKKLDIKNAHEHSKSDKSISVGYLNMQTYVTIQYNHGTHIPLPRDPPLRIKNRINVMSNCT